MTSKRFRFILIFNIREAEKIVERFLVGKEFRAFGPDSKSFWRKPSPEKKFVIKAIEMPYVPEDRYDRFSLNVYPKNYDSEKDFLYTDDKFKTEIQKALPFLEVSFSEQGLQGIHIANFDVTIK